MSMHYALRSLLILMYHCMSRTAVSTSRIHVLIALQVQEKNEYSNTEFTIQILFSIRIFENYSVFKYSDIRLHPQEEYKSTLGKVSVTKAVWACWFGSLPGIVSPHIQVLDLLPVWK